MSGLLWPGDERAGVIFGDQAMLEAMITVEQAWLAALRPELATEVVTATTMDLEMIAADSEGAGNPVVPLVRLLRQRLPPESARWVHRGLTSQDVLDSALMICARAAIEQVLVDLDEIIKALVALVRRHRDDIAVARTLTQYAVPTTFGLRAATWLGGMLDARDALAALRYPVQIGGAAGTLAGPVELAGDTTSALRLVTQTAAALGLDDSGPWHTSRAPITRIGDGLVSTSDALGRCARDVLLLARPEVAELAEATPAGRGGSSTMPHKRNPILSVLIRRAALAAPAAGAQLHLAAAEHNDERADGAWHLEWTALATLARRTVIATSQAAELITGLEVRPDQMARRAQDAANELLAERDPLLELADSAARPSDDPRDYLGATRVYIDQVLDRAQN